LLGFLLPKWLGFAPPRSMNTPRSRGQSRGMAQLQLAPGMEERAPRPMQLQLWSHRSRWMPAATACLLSGTCIAVVVCCYLLGSASPGEKSPTSYRPVYRLPEMYGKVPEKTIWSYWYDPVQCPSSERCTMPPFVQLCTESVLKNRGGFEYKIIRRDEIVKYVSRTELPLHFSSLRPAIQKDALMNALLARYGGVAMDITSILLRPLDEYWDEMVQNSATFWGYMYRMTGQQWGNSEVTAVWFLMSRREGIFTTAVRSQIIGMGDNVEPLGKAQSKYYYHNPYFALGDQTLTPILSMFNYSWPKCTEDASVGPPTTWPDMCPEYEFPKWNAMMPGPARNDATIMLREPRDGPQLPFSFTDDFSMGAWKVSSDAKLGVAECNTMKKCWNEVFLRRFHERNGPGGTHVLNFVKFFNSGGRLRDKSRAELLADKDSYFYNWCKLAGLDV